MSHETRLKINADGRVVIPASFRKALGIRAGDDLILQLEDDELRLTTLRHRIQRVQRWARKHIKTNASLVDELIAERREEARHE